MGEIRDALSSGRRHLSPSPIGFAPRVTIARTEELAGHATYWQSLDRDNDRESSDEPRPVFLRQPPLRPSTETRPRQRATMKDVRSSIPSTGALLAFEATARLGSVVRAAEELQISSPAISRHIRKLEDTLNVHLFERKGRGLSLTDCGKDYFASVQSSIQNLRDAGDRLQEDRPTLVIVCSQGFSAMFLLPLCQNLKHFLDENIDLRILNYQFGTVPRLLPAGVDVYFDYSIARSDGHSKRLLEEEVVPVASPNFVNRFKRELVEHPSRWLGVPRLDLVPSRAAYATWENWFELLSCHTPEARTDFHENYLYLADAASKGHGIALGWNGFVNDYLETGRLVPVRDTWLHTKVGLYAVLTAKGQNNPTARHFLTELAGLVSDLRIGTEDLKDIRERWVSRQPDVTHYQSDALRREGLTTM